MPTFKLTLAYDGTDFVGWQRQAAGRSVQETLEDTLAALQPEPVTVVGAGRTDAGVHAVGQVASVALARSIEAETLTRMLNGTLPPDVRVVRVDAVSDRFNARYDARSKTYRYRVVSGGVADPLVRRLVWHVPDRLDVPALQRDAEALTGRHDFVAFQSVGSDVQTTVRTILQSGFSVASNDLGGLDLTYEVTGDGFLRHMVRTMVGTLVDAARGRLAEGVTAVLRARDRQRAGPTAPAQGLCLVRVSYPEGTRPARNVDG